MNADDNKPAKRLRDEDFPAPIDPDAGALEAWRQKRKHKRHLDSLRTRRELIDEAKENERSAAEAYRWQNERRLEQGRGDHVPLKLDAEASDLRAAAAESRRREVENQIAVHNLQNPPKPPERPKRKKPRPSPEQERANHRERQIRQVEGDTMHLRHLVQKRDLEIQQAEERGDSEELIELIRARYDRLIDDLASGEG